MASNKRWAALFGISALLGLGLGGIAYSTQPTPEFQQVAVAQASVAVGDPDNLLSEEQEQLLIDATADLSTPAVVKDIQFLVFANNHEEPLDDVENWLRDNAPQLIADAKGDNGKPRDGVVIIGVGLDPRKAFAYGGDDVGEELGIGDESRLADILDAMKDDVKAGDIAGGLLKSAEVALDADGVSQWQYEDAKWEKVGTGLAGLGMGFGVSMAGGAGLLSLRDNRRKQLEQAREDHALITGEYLRLAGRLDEVDVRAHSLTSDFADAELRKDWADVRDRFLKLNDAVDSLEATDDQALRENRKHLAKVAETVRQTSNAEDNIDRLFNVERGDAGARLADLERMRADIADAREDIEDDGVLRELSQLDSRAAALQADPLSPVFIEDFLRLLDDYRGVLDHIRSTKLGKTKEREKWTQPAIYDSGFWYINTYNYANVNAWHDANVAAAHAATATASSGFSAAGGSSGF